MFMAEKELTGKSAQSSERKKRLLIIVDSDGAHQYYASILLQRLEYTIYTTKTAEEALEIMDISIPSLILTDANLARMSGIEFLTQLKRNPKTKSTPVIVYALAKDPSVRETCLREGAAAFLKKPLDAEALYAAIQTATEATPRSYVRLNTCLDVIVGNESGTDASRFDECVTALSESGMYVSTTKTRPKGMQLPITLFLGNAAIKGVGMVLYSFDRSTGPLRTPGMGIKFVRISPEDRALIRAFIEKQLTDGLPTAPNAGRRP
jgi:CheY-like chemotaxis protein